MRRHGLIWLVITTFVFLLAPLLVQPAAYESVIDTELNAAAEWYDDAEVVRIMQNANSLYRVLMVETGIDPAIRKWLIKSPPNREISPGMQMPTHLAGWADWFLNYWSGLLFNIRLFCLRLAHSGLWAIYLMPFLTAIVFDGIMTRNAKLASFKYTSPTLYNVSWHLIILIACASMVYFSLSFPIPLFYYPAMLTSIGVLMWLVISNIQHSA
jgi:hypothetical protein